VNRYEQLLNQQQQQLREQRLALALSHAEALPKLLKQLTVLLNTDPTQTHLQHYRQSLLRAQINSADILQQAIHHALRRNNIGDADRYLSALTRLQTEGDHSALAHRLLQLKQQKLASQNQQQSAQKQQLAGDLEQALNSKQWLTAKMLIDQLAGWAAEDEITAKQLSDARALLQRQVKKLVDLGQYHYTRSQLNQAIDYWQQAQALEPDDADLNNRLQRAKIFKHNVEKLQ
jgi:tetratricopeptide (TPR) repeat protein